MERQPASEQPVIVMVDDGSGNVTEHHFRDLANAVAYCTTCIERGEAWKLALFAGPFFPRPSE